jgi:hypothetical protein
MRPLLLTAALLALPAAQARADSPAEQLSGLFVQACVAHAGDVGRLRAWAAEHGLKSVPDQVRGTFLGGRPGIAYDASDRGGKFALASDDAGACAASTPQADPAVIAATLERFLPLAGARAVPTGEQDDPAEHGLHHRRFRLSVGAGEYALVVSTSRDGGLAMLTLTRADAAPAGGTR